MKGVVILDRKELQSFVCLFVRKAKRKRCAVGNSARNGVC